MVSSPFGIPCSSLPAEFLLPQRCRTGVCVYQLLAWFSAHDLSACFCDPDSCQITRFCEGWSSGPTRSLSSVRSSLLRRAS